MLQSRYLVVGNVEKSRRFMMYMLKKSLIISIFLVLASVQVTLAQQIKWMNFDEAVAAAKVENRKIIVDIYTDWCTWCQKMDQSTFQNPYIAEYVNEHYYPVKLNAEQQAKIVYRGKEYNYVRSGRRGYHELAVELALGRLSYPTVVFLDEDQQVIQALRGFQSALRFEQIMTYFARDFHKTTPWSKYSENYHTVLSRN